jgi:hypothetical protein
VAVPDLKHQAAAVGAPGAVRHAWGAASVHAFGKGLAETQVMERALNDPYLFPDVVRHRAVRRGVCSGRKAQQPRDCAALRITTEHQLAKLTRRVRRHRLCQAGLSSASGSKNSSSGFAMPLLNSTIVSAKVAPPDEPRSAYWALRI